MTPTKITGTEFQSLVDEQNAIYEQESLACIGKYGVQAARMKDEWIIHSSLPDYEGPLVDGRHITFDCKVCSQASFSWDKYRSLTRGSRSRQLRHMIKRSRFGAKCFFLMHWNERVLTKQTFPARTFVLPVMHHFDYWDKVEGGEVKSISLADCNTIGIEVEWVKRDRGTKFRPDYLPALMQFGDVYVRAEVTAKEKMAIGKLNLLAGFSGDRTDY